MSQNNELKTACEQWVRAALRFLGNKEMLYEDDIEVTFTQNGYQTRGIYKVDFGRLYTKYRDELVSLPEFSNVENMILNSASLASVLCIDAAGEMPGEISSQKYFIERHLIGLLIEYLMDAVPNVMSTNDVEREGAKSSPELVSLLLHSMPLHNIRYGTYLMTTQDFTFKAAAFEALYEKLERYIYSESFEGVWLVHIRNLAIEEDTIRLDRNVALRQATHDEKTRAVKERYRFPFRSVNSDVPNTFLEIRHSIDRISPPNSQEATAIAQAVVLALRLMKDNPVGIVSYYWDVPEQPFRPNQGSTYSPLLVPGAFSGEQYVITQEDTTILPKLYKKAKKAIKNPKLSIAITRFEDAYTRTKNEDKLIDYWTVLEALFLSDESSYQMSKTLALAISYYLGNNESERQAIKNDITRSHDLRSDVVHGKKIIQNINLLEILTKTGSHLRKALRKRIEEV